MAYRTVPMPMHADDYSILGPGAVTMVSVQVESCAGLLIHKAYDGNRGWVVSTHAGLAIAGGVVHKSTPIPSREAARRIARVLGRQMPEQVKEGKWNGREWLLFDPEQVDSFRRLVKVLVASA